MNTYTSDDGRNYWTAEPRGDSISQFVLLHHFCTHGVRLITLTEFLANYVRRNPTRAELISCMQCWWRLAMSCLHDSECERRNGKSQGGHFCRARYGAVKHALAVVRNLREQVKNTIN